MKINFKYVVEKFMLYLLMVVGSSLEMFLINYFFLTRPEYPLFFSLCLGVLNSTLISAISLPGISQMIDSMNKFKK